MEERFKYFFFSNTSQIWKDLHDGTKKKTIVSGSRAADIFGYGYDTRFHYFQSFLGKSAGDFDDEKKKSKISGLWTQHGNFRG